MSIHRDTYVPAFDRKWAKVIADTDELLTAFAAANNVANQCIVRFEEDQLVVEAANAAKTAVLEAVVRDIEWDAGPETFTLGADTKELLDAASFFGNGGETTEIRVDSDPRPESEVYTFSCGPYWDCYDFMDPEDVRSVPDLDDLDRDTKTTVEARAFKGAVGSVSRGKDSRYTVTLASDSILVEGGHTWSRMDESPPVAAEQDGPDVSSHFKSSTLREVADALPPTEELTLAMDDDFPLTVEAELLEFTIAPAIPRGEDDE